MRLHERSHQAMKEGINHFPFFDSGVFAWVQSSKIIAADTGKSTGTRAPAISQIDPAPVKVTSHTGKL